jgi:Ca2+-binding EF-hand superfamily protein
MGCIDKLFDKFDENQSNYLEEDELRKMMVWLGERNNGKTRITRI